MAKTKENSVISGLLGGLRKAYTKAEMKKIWEALSPEEQHRIMDLPKEQRIPAARSTYDNLQAQKQGVTPEVYQQQQDQKYQDQQARLADSMRQSQEYYEQHKPTQGPWNEAIFGKEGKMTQNSLLDPRQQAFQNKYLNALEPQLMEALKNAGQVTPQQQNFYDYVNRLTGQGAGQNANFIGNPGANLYGPQNQSIAPGIKDFLGGLAPQQGPGQALSGLLSYLRGK